MAEVPKIVHDRLRAALAKQGTPERVHPEADVLAAFTEQALSTTERDGVLAHLALCGDCREVVTLALPDAGWGPTLVAGDAAATVSRARSSAPHKLSFAWPSLRWAALAVGVAMVAAVLLVRPGRLNEFMVPTANRQVATNAPRPAPLAAASVPPPSMTSPSRDQFAVSAKTGAAQESRPSKKHRAAPGTTPPQAGSGMTLAYSTKEAGQLPAPVVRSPAVEPGAQTQQSANETVKVAASSGAVTVEPLTENLQMAQNDAPAIEKAKPAPAPPTTETNEFPPTQSAVGASVELQGRNVLPAANLAKARSHTSAQNATWAITAGVLQRSLDSGQSWQNAVHAADPLLCYATQGAEIWTGGQGGVLFHSADGGATWLEIQPSIKGRFLSSDITHIDIHDDDTRRDAASLPMITIATGNGEIWSSADGGKTWGKK